MAFSVEINLILLTSALDGGVLGANTNLLAESIVVAPNVIGIDIAHRFINLLATGPSEAGRTNTSEVVDQVHAKSTVQTVCLLVSTIIHFNLAECTFESWRVENVFHCSMDKQKGLTLLADTHVATIQIDARTGVDARRHQG